MEDKSKRVPFDAVIFSTDDWAYRLVVTEKGPEMPVAVKDSNLTKEEKEILREMTRDHEQIRHLPMDEASKGKVMLMGTFYINFRSVRP
jgi:hypothetical protein